MLQYSGRSNPVTRVGTCSTPVSVLPLAPAGGVGTIGVSDSSAVGQRPGSREVRREPRGCGAEQPRSVQPDGDVPSPPPLWAWVTRSTSGRATGEGNAQVPEIRIRDPPQPPACLKCTGPALWPAPARQRVWGWGLSPAAHCGWQQGTDYF